MHVLITADTVGGVWMYVRELVTGLARRRVRVTLVSFGNIPSQEQTSWLSPLVGVDYRPTAFRLEWMQDAGDDIGVSSEYLSAIIREVQPDVLHLNQYCYGNLDVDVPRLVVAHSDVVSWWMEVHGEESPDSTWNRWYRDTVAAGLAAADMVVAPSEWMMQAVRANYLSPRKPLVVHNGRNPNLFNPHITKESYALSVGRLWDAGKQVALLNHIDSPIPLYVAGAAESPDGSGARAHVSSALLFKGVQNEIQLRNLYARAPIYVATSRYEPFGLALVEAALSRCAIVANDIPSFRELWGAAICYFDKNDAESLGECIRRLSGDDRERFRYANAAYDHARKNYTSDRMVENYLGLYRSLVRTEATAA